MKRPIQISQGQLGLALALMLSAASAVGLDLRRAPDEYVVDHWGFPAGLPQVSVTSIAEDQSGYLWMSTQGGLARFDGLSFQAYGKDELAGYKPSIGDRLWRDNQDRLWLATPRGAYLVRGDELQAVDGLGAEVGQVYAFTVAPGGSVLVGTDHGVYAYTNRSAQRLGLDDSKVYALHSDGERVYAASDAAVYQISGGMAEAVASAEDLSALRFRQISSRQGRIYVGSSRGLFEIVDGQLRRPLWADELAESAIEALYGDRQGNLWIGLLEGLMRHNDPRGLEWALEEREQVRAWIASIYEDERGDLWVGSYTTGLSRWWNGWAVRLGPERGLDDPFVWSVARGPNDEVWFGTATGLWRVAADGRTEEIASTQDLRNSAVYNLFFPSSGEVWIGTRAGMMVWDGQQFSEPSQWTPLRTLQINAVLEAGPEDYWIGTSGGLFRQNGGVFKLYGANEGLTVPAVRSLMMVEDELFVGTESGLFIGMEGAFKRVTTSLPLDSGFVTALVPLPGGKLAIGTFNDGIYIRDLTGYTELATKQGLPWNSVANLQVDTRHLWVSGPRGVYRARISEIENFLLNGDLVSTEPVINEGRSARGGQRLRCCNAGATSRGLYLQGTLWFPSLNGLVRIDPKDVKPPEQPRRAIVEQVTAEGGQRWLADQALDLPEGVRDINIHYTALAFRDPESVRFRYRLQGYDADWQTLTAQRSVRYTNLAPGAYHFDLQVQGGAHADFLAAEPLTFQVPARILETASFRLLVAALAASAVALAVLLLRKRGQGRELRLQRLVDQRTVELRRANDRLRNANQALAEESLTDGLTGLKNRRFLAKFLADWRRRSLLGETTQEHLWFFLLDLDHFKAVNDRHGHLVGDDILKQFSQLLLRLTGDSGHALRWGGEEFLLLVPDSVIGSPDRFAQRVIKAVRRADFRANDVERVPISVSLGVAGYPALHDRADIADWALALELADAALYRVKTHGRDNWNRLIPSAQAHIRDFSDGFGLGADHLVDSGLAAWEQQG